MQVNWEKRGSVALQEEVPRACPEPQVSQVRLLCGRMKLSH